MDGPEERPRGALESLDPETQAHLLGEALAQAWAGVTPTLTEWRAMTAAEQEALVQVRRGFVLDQAEDLAERIRRALAGEAPRRGGYLARAAEIQRERAG